MKSISKLTAIYILPGFLCCFFVACESIPDTSSNQQLNNQAIAANAQSNYQIGASSLYVYPQGKTDPLKVKGDNLAYRWVSTDGKIEGTGPAVTWLSPNQYGTFHIMLTVQDAKGDSETATVDIGVIPPPATPCPYCPKWLFYRLLLIKTRSQH